MNSSRRAHQIEKLLTRAIAELLPRFFSQTRFGLLTVTAVCVSRKFDSAHVQISVLRNAYQFDDDARHAAVQIQHALAHSLALNKVPRIILECDHSGELLEKLEKLTQKKTN